jgi:guanyl-specific ribonuclease Sa
MRTHMQAKMSKTTSTPVQRQSTSARHQAELDNSQNIQTQMENAARFGHSLSNISIQPEGVNSADRGRPLTEQVRRKMESAFGQNFSAVRVHEGPQASKIGASAYTQGTDIHFAPGEYQPGSATGHELIGHELTHVVQQRMGRVDVPQGKAIAINQDSRLEGEADVLGSRAAQGGTVSVGSTNTGKHATPAGDTGGSLTIQKGKSKKGMDKTAKEARREGRLNAGQNTEFQNQEGHLPKARKNQHYEEFDVGAGPQDRGSRRGVQLVESSTNKVLKQYHTDDHYEQFKAIK